MKTLVLAPLMTVFVLPAFAAEPRNKHTSNPYPNLPHPSVTSAAIDAKGVAHLSTEYGEHPPWMNDIIHRVTPEYPYASRAQRNEGTGKYRLVLDLKTGAVTDVSVITSTGFPRLDRAAMAALKQWRWRPGRWKEIGLPYTFILMARY